MNLFGRKRAAAEKLRPSTGASDADSLSAPSHRLTLDLSRAKTLAAMLAASRASDVIEIQDLLAGLYIYEWDRLAAYWPEENRSDIEDLLRGICRISPQRWNHWISSYDARRKRDQRGARWPRLARPSRIPREPAADRLSAGLGSVFQVAEKIAPFHDGRIPVITSECILLCITKYIASEAGRKLNESGLDIEKLERAVIDPKRSPRR